LGKRIFSYYTSQFTCTSRGGALLENLIMLKYSRNSSYFMKPKCLLLCSQEPATFPYPKPDQGSPHPPILLLEDPFNIAHVSRLRSSKRSLSPRFPHQNAVGTSPLPPYLKQVVLISFTLIPKIILKELLQHNYIISGLWLQFLGPLHSARSVYENHLSAYNNSSTATIIFTTCDTIE
jgi:hypothetical protein